jgi:hypothetical protein
MARPLRMLILMVGVLTVLVAQPAAAQQTLDLRVAKNARLVDQGQAVVLRVTAECPAGAEVLESFVYVTQAGNQSSFGFFTPACTGAKERFTVRVQAMDAVFVSGPAQVSGYLLLTSGESISPTATVTLRG